MAELLGDKSHRVRAASAYVLGELSARTELRRIAKLLRDEHSQVRLNAVRSIMKLNGREFEAGLSELLEDASDKVRIAAIKALGKLGTSNSLPKLKELLAHSDSEMRLQAARTVCLLGDVAGASVILKQASRNPAAAGYHSLHMLNRLRSPDVWEKLQRTNLRDKWAYSHGGSIVLPELIAKLQEFGKIELLDNFKGQTRLDVITLKQANLSVLEAFVIAFEGKPYEFILERGHIRVTHHEEALRFWKHWLQRKK